MDGNGMAWWLLANNRKTPHCGLTSSKRVAKANAGRGVVVVAKSVRVDHAFLPDSLVDHDEFELVLLTLRSLRQIC